MTYNRFFQEQKFKFSHISIMIPDQISTLFHMKEREFPKTQRFLSYTRKMSIFFRKSMFIKMAIIFRLIEKSGWNFDTTFLNGMQTFFLWEFEIHSDSRFWDIKRQKALQSDRVGSGRAGSLQKSILGIEISIFSFITFFPKTNI